jgi:hypothetical protein
VFERLVVDDEIPRVFLARHGDGGKEREERATGLEEPGHFARQRLRRALVEVVEDVPAEDAVEAGIGLGEAGLEELRQLFGPVLPRVLLEVRVDVLDEELAAQAFTEIVDVAADNGAEVEQHRSLAMLERREEPAERFGGDGSFCTGRGGSAVRTRLCR